MPRMRGKETLGEKPWRVNISERLRPKALMRMRVSEGEGVGMGRCSILRLVGGPGVWRTAAFIVVVVVVVDMVCGEVRVRVERYVDMRTGAGC